MLGGVLKLVQGVLGNPWDAKLPLSDIENWEDATGRLASNDGSPAELFHATLSRLGAASSSRDAVWDGTTFRPSFPLEWGKHPPGHVPLTSRPVARPAINRLKAIAIA